VLRSIGIDATVRPVGVAADGQVEIPEDARQVGWYRFGPAAGQPRGSVVIVGHRDSRTQGAGALFRLNEAQVGDIVALTMADGSELSYRVVERRQYEKKVLPLSQLFDWEGPARLTLVTCGGPYDKRQGGYLDNIVVTALPLDSGARP
jgi:sortase (surface protein transpeptidase)